MVVMVWYKVIIVSSLSLRDWEIERAWQLLPISKIFTDIKNYNHLCFEVMDAFKMIPNNILFKNLENTILKNIKWIKLTTFELQYLIILWHLLPLKKKCILLTVYYFKRKLFFVHVLDGYLVSLERDITFFHNFLSNSSFSKNDISKFYHFPGIIIFYSTLNWFQD